MLKVLLQGRVTSVNQKGYANIVFEGGFVNVKANVSGISQGLEGLFELDCYPRVFSNGKFTVTSFVPRSLDKVIQGQGAKDARK